LNATKIVSSIKQGEKQEESSTHNRLVMKYIFEIIKIIANHKKSVEISVKKRRQR